MVHFNLTASPSLTFALLKCSTIRGGLDEPLAPLGGDSIAVCRQLNIINI